VHLYQWSKARARVPVKFCYKILKIMSKFLQSNPPDAQASG
jgi:hypothetical protein